MAKRFATAVPPLRRRGLRRDFSHIGLVLFSSCHREVDRQRRLLLAAIVPSFLLGRTLLAAGCDLVIVALGPLSRARAAPPTGCDRFFLEPGVEMLAARLQSTAFLWSSRISAAIGFSGLIADVQVSARIHAAGS